ncbi:MFS transporter [archaeon]|nr:MAG: MFS transporter [archaeon]
MYLFWTGSVWALSYQSPHSNQSDLLAYSESNKPEIMSGTSWYVKLGKKFELSPLMGVNAPEKQKVNEDEEDNETQADSTDSDNKEVLGVPRQLLPYYVAFMLDAIAVGLVMPLLPFFVMGLGADAFQLSMVVSSNYIAQSIGCLVMGRVSDYYGRKLVMTVCLTASALSYLSLCQARSLVGVVFARLISGSFGGLIPIMQSTVADTAEVEQRPKYLGRIMATFGLGFVLGPALSALPSLTTSQKIMLASFMPAIGLLVVLIWGQETKKELVKVTGTTVMGSLLGSGSTYTTLAKREVSKQARSPMSARTLASKDKESTGSASMTAFGIPLEVLLLVLNGFSIMYAFATETIYAMFIKDSFGYGEQALSTLFAVNGFFIGVFQVFLIKPLIHMLGKHATLAFGNFLLALGMIGVALVRERTLHFLLFALHVVGYSIADTALASLITKYSSPANQGRDLALNQACQSCARVVSPLLAGILYEWSKKSAMLPMGALPFLAGALCPAVAVAVPSLLYVKSIASKRKQVDSSSGSGIPSGKCWADSDDEQ